MFDDVSKSNLLKISIEKLENSIGDKFSERLFHNIVIETFESKLYYVCSYLFKIGENEKAEQLMKQFDIIDLQSLFMKSLDMMRPFK